MPGSFEFMRRQFPEIAEDGEKAESYLHTDSAACTLYISRILDGVVKTACKSGSIALKSEGQDRNLVELIDELGEKKNCRQKNFADYAQHEDIPQQERPQ